MSTLLPTCGPINLPLPFHRITDMPFPRTPEETLFQELEIHKAAAREADLLMAGQLKAAHEDKDFVEQAIADARAALPYPMKRTYKDVTVLFQGGTKIAIRTPYLRRNHKKRRGPKRMKRGKKGTGVYPVLEALGIQDRVSPATRSEIALLTVQVGSYQEAVDMLERRGFNCDPSTLTRIAATTAQTHLALRDAAIEAALAIPIPEDGPLAGKRVRGGVDGGRVRTRRNRKGRKTKKGRHRFTTPWREPRVLVIDILDENGKPESLRFPLYDALIKNADTTFSLLIGYLRMLGAAHAETFELIADGADWIWERADRLITEAGIPSEKLVQVVDFYHAGEHLHDAIELCKNLKPKERAKLYQKLRHALRHDPDGIDQVIAKLKELAVTRRGKKMKKALAYFENHAERMRYHHFEQMKLPIGSGQVESAVRRIINLRFKAPGSFWKEITVEGLMHLRAYFKAGRWNELILQVLNRKFEVPDFHPKESRKNTAPTRKIQMEDCSCADDYYKKSEGTLG